MICLLHGQGWDQNSDFLILGRVLLLLCASPLAVVLLPGSACRLPYLPLGQEGLGPPRQDWYIMIAVLVPGLLLALAGDVACVLFRKINDQSNQEAVVSEMVCRRF